MDKAEGDFRTARREFQASNEPNYDAACFHAQQSIEKLIKAVLIHNDVAPPRIHNLERLHEMLLTVCPGVVLDVEELRLLTNVGMATRYPGEEADHDDAAQALSICTRLREGLLKLIEEENV
jgi:HEPN domain-containing protein